MPVICRAVLGAVLAHRRHRNPIGKGDAAEAQWFEQDRRSSHRMTRLSRLACGFESRSSIPDGRTALARRLKGGERSPAAVAHHPAADARGMSRTKDGLTSYAAAVPFCNLLLRRVRHVQPSARSIW